MIVKQNADEGELGEEHGEDEIITEWQVSRWEFKVRSKVKYRQIYKYVSVDCVNKPSQRVST
jgi:hypothetical protein